MKNQEMNLVLSVFICVHLWFLIQYYDFCKRSNDGAIAFGFVPARGEVEEALKGWSELKNSFKARKPMGSRSCLCACSASKTDGFALTKIHIAIVCFLGEI